MGVPIPARQPTLNATASPSSTRRPGSSATASTSRPASGDSSATRRAVVDHRRRQEGRLRCAARAVHRRAVRRVVLARPQQRGRQDGGAPTGTTSRSTTGASSWRSTATWHENRSAASLSALAGYLASKGARVEYLHLPDTDDKTGLDDYLMGHTVEDLWRLVKPTKPPVAATKKDEPEQEPMSSGSAGSAGLAGSDTRGY